MTGFSDYPETEQRLCTYCGDLSCCCIEASDFIPLDELHSLIPVTRTSDEVMS